ncbi:MAG: VWA domain-containing protein [Propionibacteriales bacterium]|nr:VWA domain-containing protein [Propionibacteriales bacterium]
MNLRPLLAAGAALGLLLTAAPAYAAGDAEIDHVETTKDGTVRMLVSVPGLPAGVAADLDSVAVTVDGKPVESNAKSVQGGTIDRTTILAIDASGSMRGDRFTAAKAAAQTYLESAPTDVSIGLVAFSEKVEVLAEPTTDHGAVSAMVDELKLGGGTILYDGVIAAVQASGTKGARRVLVLSDGADTSDTPIEDAVAAAKASGVQFDAVALEQSASARKRLDQITGAAGGTVIPAGEPDALTALFKTQADELSKQVLVQFTPPKGTGSEVSLAVSLTADGAGYTDSALARLADLDKGAATTPDNGPRQVAAPAPLVDRRGLLVGGGALAVGLAGVLVLLLLGRKKESLAERQLAHYSTNGPAAMAPVPTASPSVRQSAVALAETLVKGDFESRLSKRLIAGGVSLTAAEWLLTHAGIVIVATMVGFVVGPVGLVLGFALGAVVPWLYLGIKGSRRVRSFNGQLAETLQLISGGLSAGLSLPQAVDTVVREGADPMAGEMRRALIEQRLGVDVEDALQGIADRMDSDDFAWVVIAIRIQREVGGNLAELLLTVAATLREREYLRRQVKVLSAEGRFSAYILGGLPPMFAAYLALVRPEYLQPLHTTPIGWAMTVTATVMILAGGFWLSRVVKVEV